MSDFQRIIEHSWDDREIASLRHEAVLGEDLARQIEEAKRGYREAMERSAAHREWAEYEELYTEWEDGADYAHDEDE